LAGEGRGAKVELDGETPVDDRDAPREQFGSDSHAASSGIVETELDIADAVDGGRPIAEFALVRECWRNRLCTRRSGYRCDGEEGEACRGESVADHDGILSRCEIALVPQFRAVSRTVGSL
jgi:hypothetical protein